jgi:hypothetical protein
LIAADPTSKIPDGMDIDNVKPQDMDRVKIGKYAQWLLKNFVTPRLPEDHPLMISDPQSPQYKQALKEYQDLFLEDLYKVTGDLQKFERFKNRLPQELRDINKLTPETLYDQVKDFSLEKTKATKDEKKEASKTYEHPGSDVVYRGQDWTVAKISDTGQIGKDAACFYGGSYQETGKGETRWCTSSPGYPTWFQRYITKGPLYVVIPNSPRKFTGSMDIGEKSGLPAFRYQFHFPSNQYMDPADRQINLVEFLMQQEQGLKDYFKPEFMKGLSQNNGEKVSVNYPGDSASKFIALYGLDELFSSLPKTLTTIKLVNPDNNGLTIDIPDTISEFQNLWQLQLDNCVTKIPEAVCKLDKLNFLTIRNNEGLTSIPDCVLDLPCLSFINAQGSSNFTLPSRIKDMDVDDMGGNLYSFDNEERCQSS